MATDTATSTSSLTTTQAPITSPIVRSPVVYPNPVTNGQVQLDLPTATGNVTIDIFTLAFRKVRTIEFNPSNGNQLAIQLVDKNGVTLADGLYYFRVIAGTQHWVLKILVLR